jgi:hypothetical protein
MHILLSILFIFLPVFYGFTQPASWKIHDIRRPQPAIVKSLDIAKIHPPSDAIVLYDGSDLSSWQSMDDSAPKWVNRDGYFECVKDAGYIRTKQAFGDVQLHIEWAAPLPAKGSGQGRGNSGVFLMGKYEVQVLDCYENTTYPDGQAGAVYGQYPPLVNASLPPGQWQSYDIIFRRPRFSGEGELLSAAVLTVFHNGVLVQDHSKLWGGTSWLHYDAYTAHEDRLPLSLQDHGNPVRFRNIWLRDIEPKREQPPQYPAVIPFNDTDYDLYSGTFIDDNKNTYKIYARENKLILERAGKNFELLKHSKERLSAKTTAIELVFSFDAHDRIGEMIYHFEGYETKTKRK